MKVFYKIILSFWVCVIRIAQSTQNNKFAISLQYLTKNGKNEVDFLLPDKHQRFLPIDTYHFRCVWTAMPKLPKITSLLFLCTYLKKEVSDEVDFLDTDKH